MHDLRLRLPSPALRHLLGVANQIFCFYTNLQLLLQLSPGGGCVCMIAFSLLELSLDVNEPIALLKALRRRGRRTFFYRETIPAPETPFSSHQPLPWLQLRLKFSGHSRIL